MKKLMRRLMCDEEGQGMAEYGLLLALIAVVVIVAAFALGGAISGKFNAVSTEITTSR